MKRQTNKLHQTINVNLLDFLEGSGDAYIVFNLNLNCVYHNKLAIKILQRYGNKSNCENENIFLLFQKFIDKKKLEKELNVIKKSGKRTKFEVFVKKDDAFYIFQIYPIENFLVLRITDITIPKKNEEELRRFKFMADNANTSLTLIDNKGKFLYANKVTYDRLGFTKEQFFKKSVSVIDHNFTPKQLKTFLETSTDAEAITYDTTLVKNDGSLIEVDVHISGVEFEGKKYLFAVTREIMDRKNAERMTKFLADASQILSSSLNFEDTLETIARIAVPEIADWCGIDLLDNDGTLQQVALSHINQSKVKFAKQLRQEYPPDLSIKTGLAAVLKEGRSEFYPVITEKMLKMVARNKRHLQLLQKVGFTSAMVVPIKAKNRTIGAISFISAESKRIFTEFDLRLAEEMATRASLAIENASLYQEVFKQRQRIENLVANVPGVVWEAYGRPDMDSQQIDFVSKYVEKMLGYTVEEWLQTPNFWATIIHPEDKERAVAESKEIFDSGVGGVSRFRWMRKDGSSLWIEAQSFVIHDEKGVPVGMRGVSMDITDRVEMERRKDEFISIASHELKTPITTIKGYTQILQHFFKINTQSSYYLQKMDIQLNRLTLLVNDLLDVSRVQSGKLELYKEEFAIDELIKDIVNDIEHINNTHKVRLKLSAKTNVYLDKYRMGQVITNLITNAIKYSPKADHINVESKRSKDSVLISVKDYGIGIPKKDQLKIFERFYQVSNKIRESFSGLGLGLYISAQITRRHSGEIWVESIKGKGSTFFVKVPVFSE